MAYNTNTYFLLFLPAAMLLYQVLPKQRRWMGLLLSSIAFFMLISKSLIYWAFITTAITYLGGGFIEYLRKEKEKAQAKSVMLTSVAAVTGILVGLKYTNFTVDMFHQLMVHFGNTDQFSIGQILVPIGISFYTLQAIGYLLDVYWKHIAAERNFGKLALFMIFFPTLMEGPICRWTDVSEQLFEGKPITSDSIVQGAIRIGWGLFKRMLIADRLSVVVNNFYVPAANYTGMMIVLCGITTTLQLYMEFSGTIDIVIGTAKIFHIDLPENFRQPFFAKSAAEFWRRWHISLGTWFKNYIFYPVTTSKLVKKWNKYGRKHAGKYITMVVTSAIALFPVWMLNGLWHGPKIPYILYGVYYFVILLVEVAVEPAGLKFWKFCHLNPDGKVVSLIRMVRTWLIIVVGEVLFRAESLEQFLQICKRLFVSDFMREYHAGKFFDMGMGYSDMGVIAIGTLIVFIVDIILEKHPDALAKIPQLSRPKRWILYYALIFSIIIFGAYGVGYQPADLIYANF